MSTLLTLGSRRCDLTCHGATGDRECGCVCGGAYHGLGPDAALATFERDVLDPSPGSPRFTRWDADASPRAVQAALPVDVERVAREKKSRKKRTEIVTSDQPALL